MTQQVGLCQHGVARTGVADGGTSSNMGGRGVNANILNKHSRTADKGWPSSLGVGRSAEKSHL